MGEAPLRDAVEVQLLVDENAPRGLQKPIFSLQDLVSERRLPFSIQTSKGVLRSLLSDI